MESQEITDWILIGLFMQNNHCILIAYICRHCLIKVLCTRDWIWANCVVGQCKSAYIRSLGHWYNGYLIAKNRLDWAKCWWGEGQYKSVYFQQIIVLTHKQDRYYFVSVSVLISQKLMQVDLWQDNIWQAVCHKLSITTKWKKLWFIMWFTKPIVALRGGQCSLLL